MIYMGFPLAPVNIIRLFYPFFYLFVNYFSYIITCKFRPSCLKKLKKYQIPDISRAVFTQFRKGQ